MMTQYSVVHKFFREFSLSDALAKVCANRLQARSAELLRCRGGKMVVYANDTIGNAINASGFYELTELETIFDYLSPLKEVFARSIALDVGANIGNHSIYFSRIFSQIHAFEPHPITSQILQINAGMYKGIFPHAYGLSDFAGISNILENPTNLGGSRIVDRTEVSIEVELRRIDDIDLERDKIALIKLDVEGHEANVLRGGLETLKTAMPIILFETHLSDFSGGRSLEEVDILKSFGYRFAWIKPLGSGIKRHFSLLMMLASGRKIRYVCTGQSIEPADHSMVIAVPPRWHRVLNIS